MRKILSVLIAAALSLNGCTTTKVTRGDAKVLAGIGLLAAGVGGYVLVSNKIEADKLTVFTAGDPTPSNDTLNPSIWRTQTIVWGVDRSAGMPPKPLPLPDGSPGWYFDFPICGQGHVDYVTFHHGPLTGATGIDIRYRIEMGPAVHILPWTNLSLPSLATPYFQRRLDNWTGTGKYESYRWYDSPKTEMPVSAGEHHVTVSFTDNWTAIETSSRQNNPAGWNAALADAQAMGLVFGGDTGLGHGACADGPARFVMEGYTVH